MIRLGSMSLRNQLRKILVGLLPLLMIGGAAAESDSLRVSVTVYDIEDGLSHNQVLQTFQDARGLIWLLNKDQLNRFDGGEFYHLPATERVYGDNGKILFEDQDHDLWISSPKVPDGLTFVNTYTDQVQSLGEKFSDSSFPQEHTFLGAQQTVDGISLVNEEGSVFRLTDGQLQLHAILPKAYAYYGLGNDQYGNEWWKVKLTVASNEYVLLDRNGKILRQYRFDVSQESQTLMKGGELLVMSTDELHLLSSRGDSLLAVLPASVGKYNEKVTDFVHYNILYDQEHDWIWFQGDQHFMLLNKQGEIIHNLLETSPLLRIANVYDIVKKEKTGVWLSTIVGAINLKVDREFFNKLLWKDPTLFASSDFLSLRGITKANGLLYMGAGGKMFVKDNQGVTVIDELRGYSYTAVCKDPEVGVWAGAPDTLVLFNQKEVVNKWFAGKGAYTNILKQDSKLWYGVIDFFDHKLLTFDLKTKKHQSVKLDQNITFDSNGDIFKLHEAEQGNIWLVSSTGLYLFSPQNGVLEHYAKSGEGPFHFPVEEFKDLFIDEDGVFWLASTQGLLRWEKSTGALKLYTTEDGFSHNNLYCVYQDDFGYLWMSSDNGIIQLHKATDQVAVYFEDSGITHNEFNWSAHYQDESGYLYFGGLNGVTSFHPKFFKESHKKINATPLILMGATVSGRDIAQKRDLRTYFYRTGQLRVLPNDQLLSLQFALLEYRNNDQVQYEYRIIGEQEAWEKINSNQLLLGKLAYGQSTIEVRARTGNGNFSTQHLMIPIDVIRPWYATNLSRISLFIFMALLAWLIQWQRTKRLRDQNILLEQKVNERTQLINEQKTALEALDKTKTRFFTNLTHELRTPLTLINGPIQKVLKGGLSETTKEKLLLKADASGKQLLELVNEILELARLEVGTIEVKEEPIHFADFLSTVVSQFQSADKTTGFQLVHENNLPNELIFLVDATKLRKILNNLLLNAHKFTPKDKRIALKVDRQEDWLLLEIEDEGRGIPPSEIDKIFDRYYQADNQKEAEGGTGIGLALVKELVGIMSGKIELSSTPGLGSTFKVFLPWRIVEPDTEQSFTTNIDKPLAKQERSIEKDEKPKLIGAPTLLIVEDNLSLSNYLELILSSSFNLITTHNGQEALDYLEQAQADKLIVTPDLILSDLMMPVMNGYELAEKLKNDQAHALIPLIMLTARAEKQSRLRALRMGIDDYILKPFDEEELLVRIHNLLENVSNRGAISTSPEAFYEGGDVVDTRPNLEEDSIQDWLAKVEAACLAQLENKDFTLAQLASQFHASRSTFFRKIKATTGLTPSAYLREIRLQEARRLIEGRQVSSVKEVTTAVGFTKAAYFSKRYKERFGRLPSSYFNQ